MQSQLGQDQWVLSLTASGYYVDVGAADPVKISNTYALDAAGWSGLCIDPRLDAEAYREAGRTCETDTRAVYTSGGWSPFVDVGELSTLEPHRLTKDNHLPVRANGPSRMVETATLQEILDSHDAPPVIDYLSLDTEGSELAILRAYDWGRPVRLLTVEHSHRRDYLDKLTRELNRVGMRLVKTVKWDAWYAGAV